MGGCHLCCRDLHRGIRRCGYCGARRAIGATGSTSDVPQHFPSPMFRRPARIGALLLSSAAEPYDGGWMKLARTIVNALWLLLVAGYIPILITIAAIVVWLVLRSMG